MPRRPTALDPPADTVFQWPNPARAKLWLPRGYGAQWQDPLVPQSFEDKTYDYGAFFNREDSLSLPMASILDTENGVGITFFSLRAMCCSICKSPPAKLGRLLFPRIPPLWVRAKQDQISYGHRRPRTGCARGTERNRHSLSRILRSALQTGPPGGRRRSVFGMGTPLDGTKLSAMGFTMNWKAGLDFPYMGQFLPPVKDDETWNRFAGGGEGNFAPRTKAAWTSVHSSDERLLKRHASPGFSRFELL